MLIQNKYDKNYKKNFEDRNQQNQNNNSFKPKGLEPVFLVCESCNQNNFCTKFKCEFCQKNFPSERSIQNHTDRKPLISSDSKNNNVNIVKKDKISSVPTTLNIPNTPATLGSFNIDDLFGILQSIKESSYKSTYRIKLDLNDKEEIIQSLPIENLNLSRKWECKNCYKINEKILEYCEQCFKNNDDLMNLLQTAAKIINKKNNQTEKKKTTLKNCVEYISNNVPIEENENLKSSLSKSLLSSNKKVKFNNEPKEISIFQMKSLKSQTSRIEESVALTLT